MRNARHLKLGMSKLAGEREDYIRNLTSSDPHWYCSFRVNGIVRNVDAWYRAFDVKSGDTLCLDPAQRARTW
jgi:putative endopeptidase